MMPDENGPAVPELARRATVSSCRHDPVRAFAPVLTAMPGQGSRSATSSPTPATPTATPPPGPSRCAPPERSSSRTSTPTTAARRAPTTARSSPTATCTARARPAPCWNSGRSPAPPPGSRPQTTTRKTAELARLQARPPHQRRRRRLPPGPVPRRHGQDPLPAPPRIHDPGPGPPRDPAAPRAPPGLLHPADHHRPARGARQDRAETRLPLRRLAPLLRPPHRSRTRLRHHQGPRHQQHQPRLVPPHGPPR